MQHGESVSAGASARARGWERIAMAALIVFLAAATLVQVRSVDTFWHIAAGREILRTGAPLDHDPLRFTHDGAPWVDHEWAFQAVLALTEQLGGEVGLGLLRAAFIAAAALLLLTAVRRRGVPAGAAVLVVLAVLLGARPRFFLRPELASLVGVAALLALLALYRSSSRRAAPLVAMAVLTAIWANFHPGVLVAPVVAGAYLLGERFAPTAGPSGAALRTEVHNGVRTWEIFAVPALLGAAIAANPWGTAVFRVPFEIAAALADLPATNPDWARLTHAPQPYLLAVLAALTALLSVAWRRARRLDAAAGLALLALTPLAFLTARSVGLALVAAAHLAGSALADLGERRALPRWLSGRRGAALATSAALLAAAWCTWPPSRGPLAPRVRFTPGFGVEAGRFPAGAVDELARWEPVGPLLNSAAFGGYLLWRLYPPRQVFLDTRNEVDPEFLARLGRARTDEAAWIELLDEYAIDGALVRYDDRPRPVEAAGSTAGEKASMELHTPSSYLFPRERFALVYWDDVSMLFLARSAERAEALAGREYGAIQPEDWRAILERARSDPAFRHQVRIELERRGGELPPSQRADGLAAALAAAPAAAPAAMPSPDQQENP